MKRKGILALEGAHCASCAYTIEHVGRKIKGIDSIRVQAGEQRVYVEYDGNPEVLDKVAGIVKNIGYSATIVESNAE
jgi:copper chaperone CopZ